MVDDIVKAALRKWPNVPDCYAWLALDARGDWYMRDERIQAEGPFPQVKGSRITHDKLLAFIQRNYECDGQGAWYFQNGPQRVYVELEAAPWVLCLQVLPGGEGAQAQTVVMHTHTGLPVEAISQTWVDERGRLFANTPLGLAIVRSMDMDVAADQVEAGLWIPQDITHETLLREQGVCLRPRPALAKLAPHA